MEKLISNDSVTEIQKLDSENLREVRLFCFILLLGHIRSKASCGRLFGNDGDVHGLSSRHG